MANEMTVSIQVICTKNGLTDQQQLESTVTVTGSASTGGIQTIGTTEEALAVGDVGTKGYAWFQNIDATNYVEIGSYVASTFYPLAKLKAGEVAVFRLTGVTVYAKANTSSVRLAYKIYED